MMPVDSLHFKVHTGYVQALLSCIL